MRRQLENRIYHKAIIAIIMIALMFTSIPPFTAEAATVKKPTQVTSVKTTAVSTSGIKISWKKTSNAKGYQIYMKSSKNGTYKKIKTITSGKTVTYTKKGLKSDTKYWFKVRAYNKNSKKTVYGKFSVVSTATTKHKHTWVNHTTKVQVGTEPIYDTQYSCPICGQTGGSQTINTHIATAHIDYIRENGSVTANKTQVKVSEKPVYETVTDYQYCKSCKKHK